METFASILRHIRQTDAHLSIVDLSSDVLAIETW
jgi:hypothetical protein